MSLLNEKDIQKSAKHLYFARKIKKESLLLSTFSSSKMSLYNDMINPFNPLKTFRINSSRTVYTTNDENKVLFKTISTKLSRLFNFTTPNRNVNIKVLKNIFSSNSNITIMKFDIENFFDSIPHTNILDLLEKNRLLKKKDLILIDHFLSSGESSPHGVHQGTELSNVLSDIYLNKFDKLLINLSKYVIFAKRYVDDILMVFNRVLSFNEINEYYKIITTKINQIGLNLNYKKTKISVINIDCYKTKINDNNSIFSPRKHTTNKTVTYVLDKHGVFHKHSNDITSFNYLGYSFNWKLKDEKYYFNVAISKNKLHKHFTRIYKMFDEFKRKEYSSPCSSNYYILRERIRFMCYGYILPSDSNIDTNIVIGLKQNYKYIHSDSNQINKLLILLQNNVFFLFKNHYINKKQMDELMNITLAKNRYICFDETNIDTLKDLISNIIPTFSFKSFKNKRSELKFLTATYLKRIKIY